MIELLVFFITAKQPSNPPPQPLPEKIVAVLPKELRLVKVKDEKLLKESAEIEPNPLMRQMAKIPRAKRKIQRRGMRNH